MTAPKPASGQTDLSRYDNSWFNPGPRWKVIGWFLVNSLVLNNYLPLPVSLKVAVLRWFGARIGTGCVIKPGVNIKYPWLLTIGNHVWIGEKVWIDNLCLVELGDNVCLSQGALLLTGNHDYRRSTFDLTAKPITLESGVWIGARAIVGPGVRAGSHAVLSAGSMASKALESYGIYQGNPAVRVRDRVIS
ncbi:putative colanic acid biosynthesis acetyltransferase [Spirosoma luteolum]